jgi:hypothetical protein
VEGRPRGAPSPACPPAPPDAGPPGRRRPRGCQEHGLPPRDRSCDRVPLRVGAGRGADGGRHGACPVRRSIARQAPGDAPHAVRLSPRDAAVRPGGCEQPRRGCRAAQADPRGRAGGTTPRRSGLAIEGFRAGAGGAGRRSATHVVGASRRDPPAGGHDRLRGGQVLGRAACGRAARADHALRGRADRAGLEQWRVVDVAAAMGFDAVMARRGDHPSPRGRGGRPTGRAVAARLRARHGCRHQVVARVDPRSRSQSPRRPRRGRGQPRRADRVRGARRPRADRSGRTLGRATAAARPDHDGLARAELVPRAVQRPARRRRRPTPGPRPGGTDGSSAAGARRTAAKSSCGCSRTSAPTDAAPSSTRRPA